MRAEDAAEYVGERSVAAFRRSVGKLWPPPIMVPGKGARWKIEILNKAVDRLSHDPDDVESAADVL